MGGGGGGGGWKPNLLYGSGPNPWVLSSLSWTLPDSDLPDPHLNLTWPGPGPELDNSCPNDIDHLFDQMTITELQTSMTSIWIIKIQTSTLIK